jgi:hypothetical protein
MHMPGAGPSPRTVKLTGYETMSAVSGQPDEQDVMLET